MGHFLLINYVCFSSCWLISDRHSFVGVLFAGINVSNAPAASPLKLFSDANETKTAPTTFPKPDELFN